LIVDDKNGLRGGHGVNLYHASRSCDFPRRDVCV
jgi:hypothetical protein